MNNILFANFTGIKKNNEPVWLDYLVALPAAIFTSNAFNATWCTTSTIGKIGRFECNTLLTSTVWYTSAKMIGKYRRFLIHAIEEATKEETHGRSEA